MKRSPLKPISSKRAKDMVKFKNAIKEYLEKKMNEDGFYLCERCGLYARLVIHHRKGRVGSLLWNKEHFAALCASCHHYVHQNPKQAAKEGWMEDRLSSKPFTNI